MIKNVAYLRFLCIVLVSVMLLFSVSAVADTSIPTYDENFSIRNGICFGMDKTQVKEKEKESGNVEGKLNSTISIAHRVADLKGISRLVDYDKFIVNTTIAGQKGLAIFTFDKANKMDSLSYLVNSSLPSLPLTETLISKYGSPLFVGEFAPFESKGLNYYDMCTVTDRGAVLTEYAGWLIGYKDIHILIEAIQFRSYDDGYYYENITYTPISEELFVAYENSLVQEQKSIANDM